MSAAPLVPFLGELTTPEETRRADYRAGWAEGYRDGAARAATDHATRVSGEAGRLAASAARCANLVAALDDVLAQAGRLRDAAVAAGITDTVDAALALARAVIGHELRSAEAPVRDAAARALAELPGDGVELRVHPDDLALVGRPTGVVRVVADPSVELGGCVARRDAVTVDAQIATALARVAAALSAGAA